LDQTFDHFDVELEVLQQLSLQPSYLREHVIFENKHPSTRKDRFTNVLPYAHSRVMISKLKDDPHSEYTDYINASHINLLSRVVGSKARYIAAQAPIPNAIDDWWRMIWEQKSSVVLMLTKEKEKDKIKAHRYWPEGKPQQFDRIIVTPKKPPSRDGDLIIRMFELTSVDSKDTLVVEQIQYIGWPDQGVPEEYSSFLKLFQYYRKQREVYLDDKRKLEDRPPILLHCSAGIGRTGTFCALDCILDSVEYQKKQGIKDPTINVFSVVKALRDERAGMVQTKAQYKFIFDFLAWLLERHLLGMQTS